MNLEEVYKPIADELEKVESFLESSLKESSCQSILDMSDLLLQSGGKRLRPALVILSEKAVSNGENIHCQDDLVGLATAMELIHLASLIHDDVLDGATMRRSRPSLNARLGDGISIGFGDYVYSKAFELVSKCRNPDVFVCISQAIYVMCEGELTQVCQRGNLDLSKDNYITIAKKKTASLFSACCHAGSIIGNQNQHAQAVLKDFGMNFGIAFQIFDDCRDIISEQPTLGREPGQDMTAGDMTLPLLNLVEVVGSDTKQQIKTMVESPMSEHTLQKIKEMFIESDAPALTLKAASNYVDLARQGLDQLEDSEYKTSLCRLTDFVTMDFVNLTR